jgi:two-component system alkaline phosphatase synthesis response regulator PhoP
MKILIASNDTHIIDFLKDNISSEIETQITVVSNGKKAIDYIKMRSQDIIIIDLETEILNGIEVCNMIKELDIQVHTIIFSKRIEHYTEIAAYKSGVNDFIKSTINPIVFKQRIRNICEKLQMLNNNFIIRYNELIIDKNSYTVYHNKIEYTLPKKQFLIYNLLCSKPGKVFAREYIYMQIWEEKMHPYSRTVDVHIRGIRKKIPNSEIKTYRGIGYKVKESKKYNLVN